MHQNPVEASRPCGPCTSCCKPFKIREVGKETNAWCRHRIAGKGCAIYGSHPRECKLYACMWKNGRGETSDRPDLVGVVLDFEDYVVLGRSVGMIHAYEIEQGALISDRVKTMLMEYQLLGCIIALHRDIGNGHYDSAIQVSKFRFSPRELEALGIIQNLSDAKGV